MRRRRRAKPQAQINIVPLVDVVLVLLIIFMATTAFEREAGQNLSLPRGANADTLPREAILSIARDGRLSLDGRTLATSQLPDALRARRRTASRLTMRADEGQNYGRVMELLEMARAAGFADVALATRTS